MEYNQKHLRHGYISYMDDQSLLLEQTTEQSLVCDLCLF